jgi:mercuric ion binding protein
MKNRTSRLLMLALMLGVAAWGCQKTSAKTVDIRVETAVCELCADKIETAVSKVSGVSDVEVDLESKVAQVTYNGNRTDVASLEDAIVAAGYAANDKLADPMAYERLPGCCKLE